MQGSFYRYKQIGMRSLELFWPFSILAKNLGDILAGSLSIIELVDQSPVVIFTHEFVLSGILMQYKARLLSSLC